MDKPLPTTAPKQENAPAGKTDHAGPPGLTAETAEESLIADARAGLTPAQMVERKLISLLKTNPLLVSQVMVGSRTFRR